MSRFVIAAFQPKPGRQAELRAIVGRHWSVLREQGLVTERPRYAMEAADGTIVEVFEWRSSQSIEQAHDNPAVLALWTQFEAVCEYVPVASLPEAQQPFSEFAALAI